MIRHHASVVVLILATTTLIGTQLFSMPASAITQDDINAIYQWPWWAPNACGAGAYGAAGTTTQTASVTQTIAQSVNAKEVFIFMTNNGFSAAQAAGIVGNLWIEDPGLIPTQNQIGGPAYGIAQWQSVRLDSMRSWVTANGMDPTTLIGQQAFIIEELKTDYGNAKAAVLQDSTPAAAAADWNTLYEQSADTTNDREDAANSAYAAFQSVAGSTSGGATPAQATSCGSSSSASPDCGAGVTGDAKILCTAEQYAGIFYQWGGGHNGYAPFKAACLTSGAITTAAKSSTAGNPGPCATDCSGLVSMALDQAFNQTFDWSVSAGTGLMTGTGGQYWVSVPMAQVKPGDIVTLHTGGDGHVEIVDHYDAATSTVYTFGSHYTGVTTGPTNSPLSYYSLAFRWEGPTS